MKLKVDLVLLPSINEQDINTRSAFTMRMKDLALVPTRLSAIWRQGISSEHEHDRPTRVYLVLTTVLAGVDLVQGDTIRN